MYADVSVRGRGALRGRGTGTLLAVLAFLGAVSTACGSGGGVKTVVAPEPVLVPPGVDSSVAVYADSVAAVSFVNIDRQDQAERLREDGRSMLQRSDSMWLALTAMRDSSRTISSEDSSRARDAAADGGRALVELDSLLRASDVEASELARETAKLLDSAEVALEYAFSLNPFDTRSRLWLSRVYELQARRLGRVGAYPRAIDELEKLTLLTPDEHSVFAMLANINVRLEQWVTAAANYRRAEEVYRETFDLVVERPARLDTALLFGYRRAQGDMYVRSLDAERARVAYRDAMLFARTNEDSVYIADELEWMSWDDGNLASSFARDSVAKLEQAGDLEVAWDGYRSLLPALSTQGAIDEITWRMAIVEYNLGRGAEAADRLHGLVTRTDLGTHGVPLDSTYARYVEDYGTLCLNLGREFLHDRKDNRTALKYFEQAARIVWPGRAVAYLEIATLLQSNADAALERASRALESEQDLSIDQRKDLYRLLMGLYRRSGDFEQARRFRDAYRSLP